MYNEEKMKKFQEYTLEDYNRSLVIEDIAKVSLVKKTDEKFMQIGIRPLIKEDIFIDPSVSEYLLDSGRIVAVGERDFLIRSILDKKEIERIKFKEDIKEFPKYVFNFNNAVILLSTKFYTEVFTSLWNRIDHKKGYPRLDEIYKIIPVPEKVLENKIIIIDKEAILWEKQLFGNNEKLEIKIKPSISGKADITIRSVNKIRHIDTDLIKILEIIEKWQLTLFLHHL